MAIKKLVRDKTPSLVNEGETEVILDQKELNKLYSLKVKEELIEIQQSEHKDIMEFVDLIEVAYSFAEQNGFPRQDIDLNRLAKFDKKGSFSNIVLNNLNPKNPSNDLYFKNELLETTTAKGLLNKHFNKILPEDYMSDKQMESLRYDAALNAIEELLTILRM